MIVECSHCQAKYNVDEKKIPVIGVRVRCAKCQNVMFIQRKESEPAPTVPEVKIEEPKPSAPATLPPEMPKPEVKPPETKVEPPSPLPEPSVQPTPAAKIEPVKPSPTVPPKVGFPFGDEPIPQGPPEVKPEAPAPEAPPLSEVLKPTYQPPIAKAEPAPPPFGQPTEMPKDSGFEIPKPPEPKLPPEAEKVVIERIEPAKPLPPMSEEDKRWHDRAKRLAKALASDLVLYNKDKVEQGLRDGTIPQLLGREIRRSWEYYCQQIPKHIVDGTDYFKEQLNKIVGKGKEIFK